MGLKKRESRPVPSVARGVSQPRGSKSTGREYPSGSSSSRKRPENRPVPPVAKAQAPRGGRTPGAGRVSPKPTPMAKSRDRGSTRHRNR